MIQLRNIEFERSDNSILARNEQRTFGYKVPEPQIKMSRITVALNQKYEREPIEAHGYGTAGACSSGRPPSSRVHRDYGKNRLQLAQRSDLKRWSVEMSVAEIAVLDKVSKSKSDK